MEDGRPKRGDKFKLPCAHVGCKRYLRMTMGDESMGYAYHKKLGHIDLRNQEWRYYQHPYMAKDEFVHAYVEAAL